MPRIEPNVVRSSDGLAPTSNIILLDPARLKWDGRYQKPADPTWVQAIHQNFNPDLFLPCLVSRRGGDYWLIDGQNRRDVAIKRGIDLPCIIFADATVQRESAIFQGVNHNRRVVRFYETLRAAIMAEQPWALDIDRIVRKVGLELKLDNSSPKRGYIVAVRAVYTAYRRGVLFETLDLMLRAFGRSDPAAMQRSIINGVSGFLFRYREMIDMTSLGQKLTVIGWRELLRRAAALQIGLGSDTIARAVTQELIAVYNKGRKDDTRLPDRPKLRLMPERGA